MINEETNESIYFLKGIGCICVVLLHFQFPNDYINNIINCIAYFAVPVFFMTSGYFANKHGENKEYYICKAVQIFKLTIYAGVFYFCWALIVVIQKNCFQEWIKSLLYYKNILVFLILNSTDCISAFHLWYLPALAYSYLFLYFAKKWNILRYTKWFLLGLYFIRLIVKSCMLFPDLHFHSTENWLLSGILWVTTGYMVAEQTKNKYVSLLGDLRVVLITGLLSIIFVFTDCLFLSELFGMMYSIALFLWAINKPRLQGDLYGAIKNLGKRHSLLIYILHIAVGRLVLLFFQHFRLENNIVFLWTKPILVVCVSIIFSIIWRYIIKNAKSLSIRNKSG